MLATTENEAMHELPPLTREQVRAFDRAAIEELSLPSCVLMENAGRGAAEELLRRPELTAGTVAILCGKGNNGGDGYVLARHLALHGVEILLIETAPPAQLSPDAALFREVARALRLRCIAVSGAEELSACLADLETGAVLVDGLLGTGFQGALRPPEAALLRAAGRWATKTACALVALDLPSGLDADSGACGEEVLSCQLTLTFVAPKLGFGAPDAARRLGEVVVIPIGVPPDFAEGIR